jgi:DNA-binding transcriptional ArsR family regulator
MPAATVTGSADADIDAIFRALADPTRRGVVARLGRGPATVGDLAAPFAMALPSFMQHLGVLEGAGLVRTRKTGRVRTVHLESARMRTAEDWLAAQRRLWSGRLDRFDAHVLALRDAEAAAMETPGKSPPSSPSSPPPAERPT